MNIKCKIPKWEKINKAAKDRYFNKLKEMNGLHHMNTKSGRESQQATLFVVKKQQRRL